MRKWKKNNPVKSTISSNALFEFVTGNIPNEKKSHSLCDNLEKAPIFNKIPILIKLYWSIGKDLAERQELENWGTRFIEKFGDDIQKEFPGIEEFFRRNIFRMKSFYLAYPIVPQAVALLETLPVFRISWGHNILLLKRIEDPMVQALLAQLLWWHNLLFLEHEKLTALMAEIIWTTFVPSKKSERTTSSPEKIVKFMEHKE